MNVFDHQQFLLRRPPTPRDPLGERIRRSYREIMTGGDETLRFDYPHEYLNIAALDLCAALTQAFFEPERVIDLADRIQTPLADSEFEEAVAPHRALFGIDEGVRFMQGPEPIRDGRGSTGSEPISDRLFPIATDFMNRPDANWVVALDQVPLLLFARGTFYEKSAGRGYLTGSSGDLEVRTQPVDRGSLRRTIWLNVLARENQEGARTLDYTPAGSADGYDGWMWVNPPMGDVPEGRLSLRAGLFWMVATGYLDIEEIEQERACIVTGEIVSGRVGVGVVARSTGIGYGVYADRDSGVSARQSFFLHPRGPYRTVLDKKSNLTYRRHLSVNETSGLIGQMGGLFYSAAAGSHGYRAAPVVQQLDEVRRELDTEPDIVLQCFGFHMLSSKQNIHGGCESEAFQYRFLGDRYSVDDQDRLQQTAQRILSRAAESVEELRKLLNNVVQLCILVKTDTSQKDGKLDFKSKERFDNQGFARDIGRQLWHRVGAHVGGLIQRIADASTSLDVLIGLEDQILAEWRSSAATHAKEIFERYFRDYSESPVHLAAAHTARRIFYGTLRKQGFIASPARKPTEPEPIESRT